MSFGALYIIATLLPLASFLALFLGGRRWGKTGAYVATAAIGGAFVLTLVGFVAFVSLSHGHSHADHADASKPAKGDHADHAAPADDHNDHEKTHAAASAHSDDAPPWKGSIYWSALHFKDGSEPAMTLSLGYYIDALSATMFLMVTLIATLIHIFSIGYMADELQEEVDDHQAHVSRRGRFSRFFMFLSLFCFSMLNLILTDNLFQIFVSWELVGICSYLLIGFYYERKSASNAANKAFITNRIGDAGFIIGLLIIWTYVGTFNFQDIFVRLRCPAEDAHGKLALAGQIVAAHPTPGCEYDRGRLLTIGSPDEPGSEAIIFPRDMSGHFHGVGAHQEHDAAAEDEGMEEHRVNVKNHPAANNYSSMPYWVLVVGGIGIFLGCVGKSAQFPLHVWLPDAMEGPTPVSALIHAATMVAAGVYLVGRAYPLFTPEVLLIISYTGAITLFVAATIAIVQTDIKKVLAYSTVSQLGFMMLALGVGGWVAGLFHLVTHAFFKALLFLCSGSVIYGCHHEQDMTKMGGLFPKMKVTAITMLIGVLAIAGTPFFSGWYSKDAILVAALRFVSQNPSHQLLFLLPLLTAGITAFYMFRLWFMTFTGEPRDHHVYEHAHESPRVMTVPLIILAIFSFGVACALPPWDVEGSALEHLMHGAMPAHLHFEKVVHFYRGYDLANIAGMLALLSAGLGVAVAFVVYFFKFLDPADTRAQFAGVYDLLWNKWRFDELYSVLLVRPTLVVAAACRWIDTNIIDGLINMVGQTIVKASEWDGLFDKYVIDGLVNVTGNVVYGVGAWLRVFQTGLIRNYVLFMALAAVGIFVLISYVVALAG